MRSARNALRKKVRYLFCPSVMALFIGCAGTPRFGGGSGQQEQKPDLRFHQTGIASYYASEFDGKKTASGERFDMHEFTAAHQTLPFNTRVKVTCLSTGKSVVVRINDRGPFKKNRIIDLSLDAAERIGLLGPGSAMVSIEIVK